MAFGNACRLKRADESSTAEEPKAGYVWRVSISHLKNGSLTVAFFIYESRQDSQAKRVYRPVKTRPEGTK